MHPLSDPPPSDVSRSDASRSDGIAVDFYRISLVGRLPEDQHDAFSPMLVKTIAGHTILLGPVEDQSALQGLLARIQSFGLELDELKRVRSAHGIRRRPYCSD